MGGGAGSGWVGGQVEGGTMSLTMFFRGQSSAFRPLVEQQSRGKTAAGKRRAGWSG